MEDENSSVGTGIRVYGHIRLLVPLLSSTPSSSNSNSRPNARNPRLNRTREVTDDSEGRESEGEETLDLPEIGDGVTGRDLAEAIRDEAEIRNSRRQARNLEQYASSQLRNFTTILGNIVENWDQYDLEQVPEYVAEIEDLIVEINSLLGDG